MPRQSSGPLRQIFAHRATLPFATIAETGTFAEPPQRKQAFCSCRAGIEQADGEKRTALFTEGTGAVFLSKNTRDMCPVPQAQMPARLTAEACFRSGGEANVPFPVFQLRSRSERPVPPARPPSAHSEPEPRAASAFPGKRKETSPNWFPFVTSLYSAAPPLTGTGTALLLPLFSWSPECPSPPPSRISGRTGSRSRLPP